MIEITQVETILPDGNTGNVGHIEVEQDAYLKCQVLVASPYMFSAYVRGTFEYFDINNPEIRQTCNSPSEWTRISLPLSCTVTNLIAIGFNGTLDIYKVKIESGSYVTDWSPHPDDIFTELENIRKILDNKVDKVSTDKPEFEAGVSIGDSNITYDTSTETLSVE